MKTYSKHLLLFGITIVIYIFFFQFNEPVDFENCKLCDAKEYKKLYDYFENGKVSQITYPFYTRPIIPLLASLVPGNEVTYAFHFINLIFILLSVFTINKLWDLLSIEPWLKWIGFGWLLLHWTGLIRYNLFDNLTVDVPVFFVQPLALILCIKKKYKWFYLLTPLAILQKESFLAVAGILLFVHIIDQRKYWFYQGQHLLYSIVIGVLLHYLAMNLLPEQNHQWHPVLTLLLVAKMTIDDPTRIIRWFSAFGSAYGIFPFIVAFQAKSSLLKNSNMLALTLLSATYCVFGLLAGEDMTRILFLGFPFIVTLSLLRFQQEPKWTIILALLLSFVSLHLYPIPIDNKWGVDYAPLKFVYQWAIYYWIASLLFIASLLIFRKKITVL